MLCARQNIGLQGHHESEKSSNKGNFLEILDVIARHNKIVKDRLQAGPRNAVYTSAQIHNTILNINLTLIHSTQCHKVWQMPWSTRAS